MTRLLLILAVLSLACTFSTVAQLPPLVPEPTVQPIGATMPASTVPPATYDLTIVTSTDLYIRTGAGVENSIVTVVPAGTTLYGEQCRAAGWCWSSAYAGWFCAPAGIGAGCEE
jgi:uncharacterized protein YgiM (DUF1202 family)